MPRKKKNTLEHTKDTDVAAPKYRYIGPPYPRVKLASGENFVPATITQDRIAVLVARNPALLDRYFAHTARVKPGIEVPAEEDKN